MEHVTQTVHRGDVDLTQRLEKTLTEVINTPDNILPKQVLVNVLAKRQAEQLLAEADEIF